ncbi:MAG: formate dehydrogenase subunit alpha [Dehalococcoidia bacterium]
MQTITITLDGIEVSGQAGMTILDLARESGVYIPTLCYDSHLKPYGACRICLVEDERSGRLLASCVTPIAPGMVINTRSEKVLESRRTIVKLMLASHPDSCMVCDKGNRCELRHIAAELGVGLTDFQRLPHPAEIKEVNPFLARDFSKCILCAKCIRACQELVVEGAIDYLDRGFLSRPATVGDTPLENSECTFCGTCLALCPTGALTEKIKPYHSTATKVVSTVCPFCGCGCNIDLEINANQITRAKPSDQVSPNGATLCARGSFGYDFVQSPDRLTAPLVKKQGEFEEVSWEEALDTVAERFKKIKNEYGADSLAVLGSTKCTNEEAYLLQKFARCVIGTNNVDNGGRIYNSSIRSGLQTSLGYPASTNPVEDIEESDVILLLGADPTASAPMVSYAIKRAIKDKGTKLLLIHPLRTKLASFAHMWLNPNAGTDATLINGVMRAIINEELWDQDFVARRTEDFESLITSLQKYTPEQVEEVTGIRPDDLHEIARAFAGANSAAIVCGSGVAQQVNGSLTVTALANLAMLTGNIGKAGGGIYTLQQDCNGQGTADMGCLPDYLPGYQHLESDAVREHFEQRWGVNLPVSPGLTALEMLEHTKSGNISGMYIIGENPALSFPGLSFVREALSSLDFLVVQDLFLSETAKMADVVLPAASFAEKEGTFTNFERRIQRLHEAISPLKEALPDWQIIQKLAQKMDYSMSYSAPQDIMEEVKQLVPTYSGFDYEGTQMPAMYWPKSNVDRSGTRRLYEAGFPEGCGHFSAVEYETTLAEFDKEYPMQLLVGNVLFQFGSGTRSSRSARLSGMLHEAFVEINGSDAADLSIQDGEKVTVASPAGKVEANARINRALPQGRVFMPGSFPQSPVTELFDLTLDPVSKGPSLTSCQVRVEKSQGGE